MKIRGFSKLRMPSLQIPSKNRLLLWGCCMVVALGVCVLLRLSVSHPAFSPVSPRPLVILDPGHGGMDGGAVGVDGIIEKDINLAIALKLREMLVVNGVEVLMTREEDCSIHDEGLQGVRNQKLSDMNNRLKLMKEHPDAIVVSIHQNQFTASQYNGAQMFYSPNAVGSEALAAISQRRFREMLQPENQRETKKAGKELFLLYYAPNTAILAECGFLSNREEAHRLIGEDYQNQVAFVLFSSLMEYICYET